VRFLRPSRSGPGEPRPHPQPAASGTAHPVRVHRRQVTGDARRLQRVACIPMKRVAPPETRFLERDEVEQLLRRLPRDGRLALRDRSLLLFLYNTGARVQEAADLRAGHLDLASTRWSAPARQGRQVADLPACGSRPPSCSARCSSRPAPQPRSSRHAGNRSPASASTRSCAATLPASTTPAPAAPSARIVFRHTAAVHLLEAGVEVNVIRGWLGHRPTSARRTAMRRSTPGRSWQLSGPSSLQVLRRHPAPR